MINNEIQSHLITQTKTNKHYLIWLRGDRNNNLPRVYSKRKIHRKSFTLTIYDKKYTKSKTFEETRRCYNDIYQESNSKGRYIEETDEVS